MQNLGNNYRRKGLKVKHRYYIMKRLVLFPVIMALLVLQAAFFSVEAAEEALSPSTPEKSRSLTWGRPSNMVDIGLGYLFFSSTCSWEISFPDQNGRSRSTLEFKGISGGIPFVFLDIHHPNSYASLSLQYGKGQGLNGDGTDSDYPVQWIGSPVSI